MCTFATLSEMKGKFIDNTERDNEVKKKISLNN